MRTRRSTALRKTFACGAPGATAIPTTLLLNGLIDFVTATSKGAVVPRLKTPGRAAFWVNATGGPGSERGPRCIRPTSRYARCSAATEWPPLQGGPGPFIYAQSSAVRTRVGRNLRPSSSREPTSASRLYGLDLRSLRFAMTLPSPRCVNPLDDRVMALCFFAAGQRVVNSAAT